MSDPVDQPIDRTDPSLRIEAGPLEIETWQPAASEFGRLALDVMASSGGEPPLVARIEDFAHMIALAVLAIVAVIRVTVGGYGLL